MIIFFEDKNKNSMDLVEQLDRFHMSIQEFSVFLFKIYKDMGKNDNNLLELQDAIELGLTLVVRSELLLY